MKKLFILLLGISIPMSLFGQQWQWLYPYPTTNTVIDFAFADYHNGFVIAENSEILKTADGGNTWQSRIVEDIDLIDILTIDINTAYVLGRDYSGWSSKYIILKTDDGGDNWTQYDIATGNSLNCLYFTSKNRGWAAGSSGNIRMTTDGGISWIDKSIRGHQRTPSIFYIHFTDDLNGVIMGYESYNYGFIIGNTADGGNTWNMNFSGLQNYMYCGEFSSANVYYAAGEAGFVMSTNNYGANWSFPTNTTDASIHALSFIDANIGWAVGTDSSILKTIDGGLTWQKQHFGFSTNFIGVKFNDFNTGWLLGARDSYNSETRQGLLVTDDGGENWTNKFSAFEGNPTFSDVHFIDPANGWVITGQKIYRTRNGGRSWEMQYSSEGGYYYETLNAIAFADSLIGYCVGEKSSKGFLLKTSDGGDSWTPQSLAFDGLYDIHMISGETGWLVGESGLILRTFNGCKTFEYLTSNVTDNIYDVFFLDENYGWAVTYAQTVLRTSDGGINWEASQFSSSYYQDGMCVFFIDNLTGFLGSTEGLFKSTDGGINWGPVSLTTNQYIYDIFFTTNKQGWILANNSSYSYGGGIYYTTDGGNIWNVELVSSENLYSLSFIPEGPGWAVGSNGSILTYNGGGAIAIDYEEATTTPGSYKLYQSYPNPFNPSTKISFDIPERSYVELKLFDILGRELITMVDESKEAGRYQIDLNMREFASGTYFYRIKANNFTDTKKLMLVK